MTLVSCEYIFGFSEHFENLWSNIRFLPLARFMPFQMLFNFSEIWPTLEKTEDQTVAMGYHMRDDIHTFHLIPSKPVSKMWPGHAYTQK